MVHKVLRVLFLYTSFASVYKDLLIIPHAAGVYNCAMPSPTTRKKNKDSPFRHITKAEIAHDHLRSLLCLGYITLRHPDETRALNELWELHLRLTGRKPEIEDSKEVQS